MSWPWLLQWRLRGRRFRMHWSLPVVLLAALLLLPTSDTLIGYLLILAAHHAGHLLLARRGRLITHTFDLHGLGGGGQHRGEASRLRYVLAGTGGLFGQLVLLWTTMFVAALLDLETSGALYRTLTTVNLGIMALNLLPIEGTDAAALWALPGAIRDRIEEKLTALQLEEIEAQRANWQQMIDRDAAGQPAIVPAEAPAAPDFATLLAEQDAREDAGIPDALAAEVSDLLAGAFSSSEKE